MKIICLLVCIFLIFRDSNPKEPSPSYLINTPQCRIQVHPLFDNDTLPLFKSQRLKNYPCIGNCNLKTESIRRLNNTWIHVPLEQFKHYSDDDDSWTFWNFFWWSSPKKEESITNCTAYELILEDVPKLKGPIANSLTEFPNSDVIQVNCTVGDQVYSRVVPLIPVKLPKVFELPDSFSKVSPVKDHKTPTNVLLIGLDSISRLNFHRQMNKTGTFLQKHDFQEFYGHHKVGDNTIPNVFGMMFGQKEEELRAKLTWSARLDSLPFIFKEYSNAGYLTTYIEDFTGCGLFDCHELNGFSDPIMDYYLRIAEWAIEHDGEQFDGRCYGGRLEAEYYFEYILDQIFAFRTRSQNYLTWIHLSTLSHDDLNEPQFLDSPLQNFLSHLFSTKHHLNTLIILYADHSIRIGPILETDSGFHETRLPLLYVRVPDSAHLMDSSGKWMTSKEIRSNLEHNSRRLTSQMDIHATLRHVLYERPPNEEQYGRSLFEPISENRTCDQAGIPLEYCLCNYDAQDEYSFEPSLIQEMANYTFTLINKQTAEYPRYGCITQELDQIIKIHTSRINRNSTQILVNLKLTAAPPSVARFEVNLKLDPVNPKTQFEVVGTITRLDAYWLYAGCAAAESVKVYCYCINQD